MKLFKCISDCKEANGNVATERLWSDTEAHHIYIDEEILFLLQNKPQDDTDLQEIYKVILLCGDVAIALEGAIENNHHMHHQLALIQETLV